MPEKRCFIITPLGDEGSPTRRFSDGLMDCVIKPILNEKGFSFDSSDRMSKQGSITNQIIQNLLDYELVIANLTGLNPNVMYELAVRHCKAKPLVTIAERGTKLPFDVIGERTIFFSNDMQGVIELKNNLTKAIDTAIIDSEPADNPVFRVVKDSIIRQEVKNKSPQDYIVTKLQEISDKLNRFQTPSPYSLAGPFSYSPSQTVGVLTNSFGVPPTDSFVEVSIPKFIGAMEVPDNTIKGTMVKLEKKK